MNLHILDIPESDEQLAAWLEEHLIGESFLSLVSQIIAVHGERSEASLDECLHDKVGQILKNGFAGLERETMRELFKSPRALLELQERIFADGGPYWQAKLDAVSAEVDLDAEAAWRVFEKRLAAAPADSPPVERSRRTHWNSRSAWTAVGITLALLVAILTRPFWSNPVEPIAASWGFDNPTAIDEDLSAAAYLRQLATSASQWSNKRPETQVEIETRIREFIHGCDTLISSPHRPLPAEDRRWLVDACRKCRGEMVQHVRSLRRGEDPLTVRAAADETVERLIQALNERANTV